MRLGKLGVFSALVAFSTAAYAGVASYGSYSPSAPSLTQKNSTYSLGNFPNNSSPNASAPITTLSYQANYNSTSQGTVVARLCTTGGVCNAWGNLQRLSIGDFTGYPARTVFYLQVRVNSSTNGVLSPSVTPAGRSSIDVNYTV